MTEVPALVLPGTVLILRESLQPHVVKQALPDGLLVVNKCDAIGPYGPDIYKELKDFIPNE